MLTDISCVQSCMWSTVTPASFDHWNTIANVEPSGYLCFIFFLHYQSRCTKPSVAANRQARLEGSAFIPSDLTPEKVRGGIENSLKKRALLSFSHKLLNSGSDVKYTVFPKHSKSMIRSCVLTKNICCWIPTFDN